MFFGIYLLVASIFLFFSIISLSIWSSEKKRKNDLFFGLFFLIMSLSYGVYALSGGMPVGGEYALNYVGYVLDLFAGILILFMAIYNIRNNREFFKNIFKK